MSSDRRENFRFALPPEQRRAKLKVAGKKHAAEILEQSATGFRVEVPADAQVALNDVVTLDSWSGTCQAVVAYVEDVNKMRRLGLKRISDDVPTSLSLLRYCWNQWQPTMFRTSGSVRGRLVAAGCLGMAVAGTSWGLLRFERQPGTVSDRPAAHAVAKVESPEETQTETTDGQVAPADEQSGQSPPARRGSKTQSAPAHAASLSVAPSLAILQRLLTLQTAETATQLDLSEKQKLEISQLLDETSLGLSRLQSRRSTRSSAKRKEMIQALFDQAESRALKILTPQQRNRWQSDSSARASSEAHATAMTTSAADK